MTPSVIQQSEIQQPDSLLAEGISTLHNISWKQFKAIDAALGEQKGVKLSYLNGMLEIMSPIGSEHELVKSTLGLLLEAYWREKDTRFYRCGGFTTESPETASGIPDESYAIGSPKEIPDIVIEVIITSGRLDKKEIYRPQQVPEVWFWRKGQIAVFGLSEQGYEPQQHGQFLPDLDLAVLERYLSYADQYDAVTDLIRAVRQGEV